MRFVFVNTTTFLRKMIIEFEIIRMICFYVEKRFTIKKKQQNENNKYRIEFLNKHKNFLSI